jgi:hypothetical protein
MDSKENEGWSSKTKEKKADFGNKKNLYADF